MAEFVGPKASCVIIDGVVKGSLDGKVKAEEGGDDEPGDISTDNCRNLIERVYLEADLKILRISANFVAAADPRNNTYFQSKLAILGH